MVGAVHLWLTFLHQAIRLRNVYFAMLERPASAIRPPKHVRGPVAHLQDVGRDLGSN